MKTWKGCGIYARGAPGIGEMEITRCALGGMGFAKVTGKPEMVFNCKAKQNGLSVWWIFGVSDVLEDGLRTYPGVYIHRAGLFNGVLTPLVSMPHIRTLPQLRQLIRSLFGDDALPRRELSSITDEELVGLLRIVDVCCDNTAGEVAVHSDESSEAYCSTCGRSVRIKESGTVQFHDGAYLWEVVNPSAYRYLINELDMHLPAFHGARELTFYSTEQGTT